ncbi:hypothetical protein MIR68_009658 [Amoeboaphelidium protococcarum]|nr:hypothetical protein MIR68_009658 [Amoeboaphelidium protococcarum]KAI3646386.1 hypothetical protein MP228_009314 [Amoeboaphelidium protococcarum]KAI3652525.1 hypothetical protein MP228_001950 [Amoeboaphelidium protococcarum]
MGICISKDSAEQAAKNAEIEKDLKAQKAAMKNEVKMLLLGAGESGKSTILKQMQLIHGSGYNAQERESYKEIIFSNVSQSMKVILEAMEVLKIELSGESNKKHASVILELPPQLEGTEQMPKEIADAIKALWTDAGVQKAFARKKEYQLNDSAKYYFDNIDRICAAGYAPSDQDILHSRVKTTGIIETTFKIDQLIYRMFDVGGQRSERKKWIHCFENVTAVIFLAAISEYDQTLIEDETVNRIQEALTLFDSICNSKWFANTSMILFLNKIDLFKEKLTKSPLSDYFSDFSGGDSYEQASAFLLNKFVELNKSPQTKQIYAHFTCATDTAQIKFVMAAVTDIIIQKNLRDTGLM